ncbi:hypothetical protein RMSM_06804 [Rhodopirellula maiorica SM1]|uniref:Uncharacterized protein n=1 Tax=Rhodopirellula maiorica SM1 TaxID=1265738 RepID=M5R9U6_9BACT|nr:hypothetical protein RMSM_06804 [Rhodopirellula maiorica SM1]
MINASAESWRGFLTAERGANSRKRGVNLENDASTDSSVTRIKRGSRPPASHSAY